MCWLSEEHASHCGKIRSTTYPAIRSRVPLSIRCASRLVSKLQTAPSRNLTLTSSFAPCSDHSKIIGFSFDSSDAASEFWRDIERLISNPENIALSAPGRKRSTKKPAKQKPLPPKTQISHPCQFMHVTNVSAGDTPRYHSLQVFKKNDAE